MNMKQLKYVLVLAREGSFSRAADSLGISQPSLSQYIKKIEREMGLDLFDRSGGDVRVTDAGQVYIDAGRKILDLEQQMERKLEDLAAHRSGSIVVGVSPHRCVHLMPEIVRRFQALYPGMHLVIEERAGASLLDDAEHGQFDLCIATLPVNEKTFTAKVMMREEVVLAVNVHMELYERLSRAAKERKDRMYPSVDLREAAGQPFVCLSEHQPTQKTLDEVCAEYGFEIKKAVECRTIETQFAMVRSRIGAALLPTGISAFSTAGEVAFFSVDQEIPFRDMAVIYRREQYLSQAVQDLIEIIQGLDISKI